MKLIHFIENLQVERKLRLCQEFLDVFGRVDPGQATDWWAVTQLEAIGAKSVLLQRDLESGKIPASAFKEALIGRVTSVVKFLTFEFKIQFTGYTRLMRISLEQISLHTAIFQNIKEIFGLRIFCVNLFHYCYFWLFLPPKSN